MTSDQISISGRRGSTPSGREGELPARLGGTGLTLIGLLTIFVIVSGCGAETPGGPDGRSGVSAEPPSEAGPVVTVPDDILAGAAAGDSGAVWAPLVIALLLAAVLIAVLRNIEIHGRD